MSKAAYAKLAGFAALAVLCIVGPANALTMEQCSEKYKAANKSGGADAMSWNDFRKAECGTGATMALKKSKEVKAEKTAKATKEKTTAAAPGEKVSAKQCSARYRAAKTAGTLDGMTWNEFRAAGCVSKTANAPLPTTTKKAARATPPEATKVSEKECSTRYQSAKSAGTLAGMSWNEFRSAGCPTTMAKRSGSMTPTMGSVFPTTVSRKYAGESAGRARLLTCRDQYEANKAAGITEPKWTEKGGGYYSECNKHLSQ
ncbi:MAG: hypothetical protein WC829_10335 [Hyphomicrobium sp.]